DASTCSFRRFDLVRPEVDGGASDGGTSDASASDAGPSDGGVSWACTFPLPPDERPPPLPSTYNIVVDVDDVRLRPDPTGTDGFWYADDDETALLIFGQACASLQAGTVKHVML